MYKDILESSIKELQNLIESISLFQSLPLGNKTIVVKHKVYEKDINEFTLLGSVLDTLNYDLSKMYGNVIDSEVLEIPCDCNLSTNKLNQVLNAKEIEVELQPDEFYTYLGIVKTRSHFIINSLKEIDSTLENIYDKREEKYKEYITHVEDKVREEVLDENEARMIINKAMTIYKNKEETLLNNIATLDFNLIYRVINYCVATISF